MLVYLLRHAPPL